MSVCGRPQRARGIRGRVLEGISLRRGQKVEEKDTKKELTWDAEDVKQLNSKRERSWGSKGHGTHRLASEREGKSDSRKQYCQGLRHR